jgi:hypothetical protein
VRRAAAAYSIPRGTLLNRRAGIASKRDSTPKSKKLTKQEEAAIVQHIHGLCAREFPLTLNSVRDMANKLLAKRDAGTVGRDWPLNFVKRTAALKTQFSRTYDHARAICENSVAILEWFELVQQTRARYSILDEDIWNFDETGNRMGAGASGVVVTGSEIQGNPKVI